MGQRGEKCDRAVVGRDVERDGFAMRLVVLVYLGQKGQQRGMGRAAQNGGEHLIGECLEASSSRLFDVCVRIVGEHEENGRQLDRFQGQGTPGRHHSGLGRRIPTGVFLGFGRELQRDFLSGRRLGGQRVISSF